MDHLFACSCGEVIVKSSPGIIKIRNKILVFKGGEAFAACPKCGAENKVPLLFLESDLSKSDRRPRLFLKEASKIVDTKILKR